MNILQIDLKLIEEELIIAALGYVIVFIALVALYYTFRFMPKILEFRTRLKLRRQGKKECAEIDEIFIAGDINAAISAALYMYFNEIHDTENYEMTIKKVSKTYSPWSSKIYGLNMYRR